MRLINAGGRWSNLLTRPPPIEGGGGAPPPGAGGGGGGPSPSSAISDMYSWSILLPPPGPPAPGRPPPRSTPFGEEKRSPGRRCLQSSAIWPAPPHAVHVTLLVTLALSWHCHALWLSAPQLVHLTWPSSRRVPFNRASSLSWILRSSLEPSGRSTPSWIICFTLLTAFFTQSGSVDVMYACSGSFSPGRGWPLFLPTFPSFTLPLPRMMILAPVSFSRDLSVLPLGPMMRPMKLISGWLS